MVLRRSIVVNRIVASVPQDGAETPAFHTLTGRQPDGSEQSCRLEPLISDEHVAGRCRMDTVGCPD
ncbi:MAG TPA: hypothetical protein PKH07_15695, partial [bacterium]|nr:hypothetical protein [bacterium]